MLPDDYYSILTIHRDASRKEIKKAYRILAKKFHPDSSTASEGSAEIFTKINEAYSVLFDPDKKKEYDAALFKFESRSHRGNSRSSTKGRYSSRSEESKRRSHDNRIWKEQNASFQSGGSFSSNRNTNKRDTADSILSKPFQSYQRKQKFGFFLGALLTVMVILLLFRVLFLPSVNLRNTGRGSVGDFVHNTDNSPLSPSEKKKSTKQIRKELYRELIIHPEVEKRIARSLKKQFKQNPDSFSTAGRREMLFETNQEKNLADEIWEDSQDPVFVP